jgi:hypothetical protein
MSIIFHHYKQLIRLLERLEGKEDKSDTGTNNIHIILARSWIDRYLNN